MSVAEQTGFSGREGLWTEPQYPGDSVRRLDLHRNRKEFGDVRIQHLRPGMVKVCSFLPGDVECPPGDTPKVWPEKSDHCTSAQAADALFEQYVAEAYAEGWQNLTEEVRNGRA